MKDESLWLKIENFELANNESELPFSQRLAQDNNWSLEFAKEVIIEYRKFIYLCSITETEVIITPSDSVDQVWHLHLAYTESYWKKLCKEVIGKEIHHNPTEGGEDEKTKFENSYDMTFLLYNQEFGQSPSVKIWPDKLSRFNEINYKRINFDKYWLIRKPQKYEFLIMCLCLVFVLFYLELSLATSLLIIIVIAALNIESNKVDKDENSAVGCGGCGGCG